MTESRPIRIAPPIMPVSDAPMPISNETCPECSNAIIEGSAWRIDAQSQTRMHADCLTARKARAAQRQQATPLLSRLDAATDMVRRAQSDDPAQGLTYLALAIDEIIAHLKEAETR